jgi:glycosyltransferase involved in cell wall biosynthesis
MKLSILIPSRNENFLARTIQDILEHKEDETEVIAVLDGQWADPAIPQYPNVNVIYVPESVGMRGATNLAAKLARGKYIMKVDAHCSFDQGFDRKMIEFFEKVGDNVTAVPIMRNLWAFDWKCYHCGWKKYQGPTPTECGSCGKTDKIRKKMIWQGKHNPQSWSFRFDAEPHFQYFEDYKHRPETRKMKEELGYTETMSIQGSCFMCTKENYLKLKLTDEKMGNWGNEGIEVACKTWLSGGRVLANHNTWYAHMFRTQGGDFGFPYENRGKIVSQTKGNVKSLLWEKKFEHQIHPVSWLVEKFWPVPGWSQEQLDDLKKTE